MDKTRRKTKRRKKCPNGTIRNKKKDKCEKKKKNRKSKFLKSRIKNLVPVKTIKLKSKTPKLNKEIRRETSISVHKSPSISKSFSPSINNILDTLQDITPEVDLFSCGEGEVKIKTNKGYECKDFIEDAEEVQKTMLKNLNITSSRINFDNIMAPKQISTNCWFNVYFMNFFISDKGRKFFRYLRKSMITGILPNNDKMDEDMHFNFSLFNLYIEASLAGKNDPQRFAETMDTNTLLLFLGEDLRSKGYNIPYRGNNGNPLVFYNIIMNFLDENIILSEPLIPSILDKEKMERHLKTKSKIPDILFILKTGKKDTEFKNIYNYVVNSKKIKYKLDSAIISSSNKKHYTSCITGNTKEYGFDGASFSRLVPFNWKDKINKDITWKFIDEGDEEYNFKTCDIIYFYYRS